MKDLKRENKPSYTDSPSMKRTFKKYICSGPSVFKSKKLGVNS